MFQIWECTFKTFSFFVYHGATLESHWTKQTVKKLNLWWKTAVDKSIWIKACPLKYLLFLPVWICSKFTGEHLFRSVISIELSKSHFDMGVLLWIWYIFSEHFSIRTPVKGCFWLSKFNDSSPNWRYKKLPKSRNHDEITFLEEIHLQFIFAMSNITWNMIPGNVKPGTWHLKPDTCHLRHLEPGTCYLTPGTWHLGPAFRTCPGLWHKYFKIKLFSGAISNDV